MYKKFVASVVAKDCFVFFETPRRQWCGELDFETTEAEKLIELEKLRTGQKQGSDATPNVLPKSRESI